MPVSEPYAPILVVDDDRGARSVVALALRRAGFDVIEADGGEAALRIVQGEGTPIGLVVLDVNMPGISGMDVVRALRDRPQTTTLPVILMTGSGDEQGVVMGLDAGADDFLAKPLRLKELVARVQTHLRNRAAWRAIEQELRARSEVVQALSRLPPTAAPEEAAEAIVAELARRTASDFIGVAQLLPGDRLIELATYNRVSGVRRGGEVLAPTLSQHLVRRSRAGPWVEDIAPTAGDARSVAFAAADLEVGVGAPIFAGNDVVGLLSLGVGRDSPRATPAHKAALLASAIDYASMLSALVGAGLAHLRDSADMKVRLEHILRARQFQPVFQPIVDLGSLVVVGYEALTRFDDGVRPDLRFAEAGAVGLGQEFELATIRASLLESAKLPAGPYLSLNISPRLVIDRPSSLLEAIATTPRRLVIELTEHVRVDDYVALREALEAFGDVGLAVDDAGAGYASLRHIVELGPTYTKIDISIVHGIEGDDLRRAVVAGLASFALRTGGHLIAEGVETDAEASELRNLGVEFGQGYLFGRPVPA